MIIIMFCFTKSNFVERDVEKKRVHSKFGQYLQACENKQDSVIGKGKGVRLIARTKINLS